MRAWLLILTLVAGVCTGGCARPQCMTVELRDADTHEPLTDTAVSAHKQIDFWFGRWDRATHDSGVTDESGRA